MRENGYTVRAQQMQHVARSHQTLIIRKSSGYDHLGGGRSKISTQQMPTNSLLRCCAARSIEKVPKPAQLCPSAGGRGTPPRRSRDPLMACLTYNSLSDLSDFVRSVRFLRAG